MGGVRIVRLDLPFDSVVSFGATSDVIHFCRMLLNDCHRLAKDFSLAVFFDHLGGHIFLLHLIQSLVEFLLVLGSGFPLLDRPLEVVLSERDRGVVVLLGRAPSTVLWVEPRRVVVRVVGINSQILRHFTQLDNTVSLSRKESS